MNPIAAPGPTDATDGTTPVCAIRCLATAGDVTDDVRDTYLFDGPTLDAAAFAAAAGIVLPGAGAIRAAELLTAGARRVLMGEAALLDSAIVSALAATFGGERVGVYVPARRMQVSWSFDTVSNADFKVLTPSLGAPAWEALRADGTRTGTQALWWIGEMLKLGASEVLLRVDIRDDADLNLCADCIEQFGDRVWIGPLADVAPRLDEWTRYGRARQVVLSPHLYTQATAIDPQAPAVAVARGAPVERAA